MAEALEATEQITETPLPQASEPIADVQSGDGGSRAADVQSGIDEGLASLARDYGFDPDEWSANPAALEKAVTQFDRLYSHHQRLLSQPRPETKAEQKAQAAEQKRTELALKAIEGDFDPEVLRFSKETASTVAELNQRLEAYEKRFGEIGPTLEKVAAMEQYVQAQESQRFEQMLDDSFEKLGDEFRELYGKGPMNGLKATSLHAHNRNAVANALAEVQHMDAQAGRRTPLTQQFKRAQQLAHGDQLPTIERRRLALKAHQNKSVALSRPASKTGQPPLKEDQIMDRIGEWQSRVG